jgi:tetratricopeptide (TPR) repeat protein
VFLLQEQCGVPAPEDRSDDVRRLKAKLQRGRPSERQQALLQLVAARAEVALTQCLRSRDPLTVELATTGLWECWLSEKGEKARRTIDHGTELMHVGEFATARSIFESLARQFPDWAEAHNKQATLLYLTGDAGASLDLCEQVVALKPNHFGAWNGMALCAVQLEKWTVAARAARRALRLQPSAGANRDILQLAQTRLRTGR